MHLVPLLQLKKLQAVASAPPPSALMGWPYTLPSQIPNTPNRYQKILQPKSCKQWHLSECIGVTLQQQQRCTRDAININKIILPPLFTALWRSSHVHAIPDQMWKWIIANLINSGKGNFVLKSLRPPGMVKMSHFLFQLGSEVLLRKFYLLGSLILGVYSEDMVRYTFHC